MKKLTGIFLLALIAAAGIALVYLLVENSPKKVDNDFAKNIENIQELKGLDSSWSLSALTAYNTPNSNFDKVASFLPKVRELRNTLENSSLASSEAPETMKNKLSRFLLLVEGKEVAIESFKSNFAVVRNSLKFLPLASQTLSAKLRTMGDADASSKIIDLYERTNGFLQNPDEGTKVRLLIDLSKMNDNLMNFPSDVANPLGNFISHARVLVERKIDLNSSVDRLVEQEVIKAGDELLAMYKDHYINLQGQTNTRDSSTYVRVLSFSATLILLGLISSFLLWRIRKEFDQKLEDGIAERTEAYESVASEASSSMVDKNLDDSLAGMGRMAATVAHEINTPLGYLGSNLQVLHNGMEKMQTLLDEFSTLEKDLSNTTDSAEIKARINSFSDLVHNTQEEAMLDELPEISVDMQEGLDQIQHIANDLRDFTRKDRSAQDQFDINDCVESAIKMARKEISEGTKIDTDLAQTPELFGSPAEINQVLINLINNAAHAIDDAERGDKGFIKIKTSLAKDKVMVSVMDNGLGIDEETRSKIFEPFFTTKDVGKGTGLGLAIVRRIITTHGGKMQVKSVPGKGTNFAFVLPVKKDQE